MALWYTIATFFFPCVTFLEGVFSFVFVFVTNFSPSAHSFPVPFNMLRLPGYILEMYCFGMYQSGLFYRFVTHLLSWCILSLSCMLIS